MKMYFSFFGLALLLSACATTESMVEKTISPEQAIVSIGKNKLQPGDKVGLYAKTCKERTRAGKYSDLSYNVCSKSKVGHGEIVRLVSEKEAVVESKNDIFLEKGLFVEKE